jgi:hypothetical protein
MTNLINVDFKARKKLSEADLALLKSRGKVLNGFTTKRDEEIVEVAAPVNVEKNKTMMKKARNAKSANKGKAKYAHLIGKTLHTSWGYDMTINNFCQIVDVSPTGKTVTCRMVAKTGFNGYQGNVKSGTETYGPKFRLKHNPEGWNGEPTFHGSYPFCGVDRIEDEWLKVSENSTRMGYFGLHNPDHEVFENHMD